MEFYLANSCPKQLADMAETAEGWHCASCNRTVVDLTNATESDVAEKLAKGPVCGEVRTTSTGRLLLAGETASDVGDPAQVTSESPHQPVATFVWNGRTSSTHSWTALRTWDVQKSAGQAHEERLARNTQRKARRAKHAAVDTDPIATKQ